MEKKRGRPGAAWVVRSAEFAEAYRTRPRDITTRDLAEAGGFPFASQVPPLFSGPVKGTQQNLERFAKLAKALKFKGETHRVMTESELENRASVSRMAETYWEKAR